MEYAASFILVFLGCTAFLSVLIVWVDLFSVPEFIVCFRHLAPQLQELNKVISKMLYEEFVTLIQKELGRPCENESDAAYQGVTL